MKQVLGQGENLHFAGLQNCRIDVSLGVRCRIQFRRNVLEQDVVIWKGCELNRHQVKRSVYSEYEYTESLMYCP